MKAIENIRKDYTESSMEIRLSKDYLPFLNDEYDPNYFMDFSNSNISSLDDIGISKDIATKVIALDLSGNNHINISSIDDFKNLQFLFLKDCKLTIIDDSLFKLENLIHLDLRGNEIEFLSDKLIVIKNLVYLNFYSNSIKDASIDFSDLESLRYLNLSHNELITTENLIFPNDLRILLLNNNKIDSIPSHIGNCGNLKRLNLSNNLLKEISNNLYTLSELKNFDINHNKLVCLGEELGNLKKLSKLNVGFNYIKEIPESIGLLDELDELHLTLNPIKVIPDSISNLISLKKINLDCIYSLKLISENILKLKSLTFLSMCKCNIYELPSEISQLKNLERLILNDNRISIIPDVIATLNELRSLYLANNKVKSIAGSVLGLPKLEQLDLQNNQLENISEISSEFTECGLIKLDLHNNKLEDLPIGFDKLTNLQHLNLSSNKFKAFPQIICKLIKIETLYLRKNKIKELPNEIGDLQNLVILEFWENNLVELPTTIGLLKSLKVLALPDNKIKSLPKEIGNLVNIRNVGLSGNELNEIPVDFANLTRLEKLNIDGNPFDKMPQIKSLGINDLMTLLNKLRSGGFEHYNINLDKELRQPFIQFLSLFKEYVRKTKNKNIYFEVSETKIGVLLEFREENNISINATKEYFIEYGEFIRDNTENYIINIENISEPNIYEIETLMAKVKALKDYANTTYKISKWGKDSFGMNNVVTISNENKLLEFKVDILERELLIHREEKNNLFQLLRDSIVIKSNKINEMKVKNKNKILFLTSNPSDTSRLRIDKEARDIEEGLRRANQRDSFDFEVRLATRPRDLSRAILDINPQILHFSGHGETEGIVLEDEDGTSKIVTTEAISGLFNLFSDTIHCVILNSCYSISQAQEISKYILFVIGMSKAIPDSTAITFATSFYDAIGAGRDIEFAFNFGVSNIILEGLKGNEIPVLIRKNNQDPISI